MTHLAFQLHHRHDQMRDKLLGYLRTHLARRLQHFLLQSLADGHRIIELHRGDADQLAMRISSSSNDNGSSVIILYPLNSRNQRLSK